jgi:hypothetical protein
MDVLAPVLKRLWHELPHTSRTPAAFEELDEQ